MSPMVQVQDCTCNTHARARAHTRTRRHSQHGSHDRNAWTQESHAECESKLPYCCEYAAAVTHRRNRNAQVRNATCREWKRKELESQKSEFTAPLKDAVEQVPCRACSDRDVHHRGYGLIRIITGRKWCNPFARMCVRSHARKPTYSEHTRNRGTQKAGYAAVVTH